MSVLTVIFSTMARITACLMSKSISGLLTAFCSSSSILTAVSFASKKRSDTRLFSSWRNSAVTASRSFFILSSWPVRSDTSIIFCRYKSNIRSWSASSSAKRPRNSFMVFSSSMVFLAAASMEFITRSGLLMNFRQSSQTKLSNQSILMLMPVHFSFMLSRRFQFDRPPHE